ncbi:MAG TPA: VWA domain-containing protein [Thiotrichaceae bacterium]|nr:VWA domain-containing protein [Thiotrichaceae bacterium]
MDKQDLLCAISPLQSDKGLDRKIFIKTPDSKDPSTATVPAYPSYQGPCNGRCKQLSRFHLYFIYANDKENQRYLVIYSHTLEGVSEPPPLVGWVEHGRTIPWNTTLGMRPKEEIERIPLQSRDTNKQGIELGGGNIWYTLPIHIPILDIDRGEQLYHVAAPGIGIEGFKQYKNVLSNMKLVDVFFLIDGTASMGPYIKAARQAVENIAYGLRNELDFKETSFRFGFRVYRDTYADSRYDVSCQGGICEGMPLSTTNCQSNQQATDENWQEFVEHLGNVKETRNDKDDYPEKLFDGLRQAIEDMEPCPERTKMLFVIGDHGDRKNELPYDIVDDMNDFDRKAVFFIQTSKARTSRTYRWAYSAYRTQAFKLLDRVLPPEFEGKTIARTDYFLSLSQTQLARQVVAQVKKYSPSALINELEQALAGGDSLDNILKRSMATEGGMPILYWKWIEESACPDLGQQCKTAVNHRVVDFYIPTLCTGQKT